MGNKWRTFLFASFAITNPLTAQNVPIQVTPINSNPLEFNDTLTNSARRTAEVTVTVTANNVTLTITPPVRPVQTQNEITQNQLADILIGTSTVQKTAAEIATDKKIEATLKVSGLPNPTALTGYSLYMQTLTHRLNFEFFSSLFYNLEALPVTPGISSLLFFQILNNSVVANKWLNPPVAALEGLPAGIALSKNWTSDQILEVTSTARAATNTTFSISIPAAALENLPTGTYWMNLILTMQPYTVPSTSELISETTQILSLQINALNNLIDQGNTILSQRNSLFQLTASQRAQVTTNITHLQNQLTEIQNEYTAFFTKLANESTTTTEEHQQINGALAILNNLL